MLCNCFSHVSTQGSVSLSTWDLSNYSCCIPLIVWHTYTQEQKDKTILTTWVFNVHIWHISSQYLLNRGCNHVCLNLLSKSTLTLSLWLEPFQDMWVAFIASSHFHIWFNNDLILHTIWLLIAWLMPRLHASSLFFTTAVVHRCPSPRLSFTFVWSFETLSLLSSSYQAILKSHHILNWHYVFIWSLIVIIIRIQVILQLLSINLSWLASSS
jgi:hypothetical protein